MPPDCKLWRHLFLGVRFAGGACLTDLGVACTACMGNADTQSLGQVFQLEALKADHIAWQAFRVWPSEMRMALTHMRAQVRALVSARTRANGQPTDNSLRSLRMSPRTTRRVTATTRGPAPYHALLMLLHLRLLFRMRLRLLLLLPLPLPFLALALALALHPSPRSGSCS